MALSEVHFKITGMTCGHCERTVKQAIQSLDGIISVQVDQKSGTGIVVLNDALVSPGQVVEAIDNTGIYQASVMAA